MTVDFFAPGAPASQGSKRHIGNGRMIESSKLLGPWRERVAWFAVQAMKKRGAPITGAVVMNLEFVMPRPKSAPKTRAMPAIKRPDIDKLSRAIFDALSGVCYVDDSQVVGLKASKRIALPGEYPGCHITITEGE